MDCKCRRVNAGDVLAGIVRENPGSEVICRRIFLALVNPGEGSKHTRKSVAYDDLASDAWSAEIVSRLIDARLLTASDGDRSQAMVELCDEALIEHWPKFRAWIEAEREGCGFACDCADTCSGRRRPCLCSSSSP